MTEAVLVGEVVLVVSLIVVVARHNRRVAHRTRINAKAPYKQYEDEFWNRPWDDKNRKLSKDEGVAFLQPINEEEDAWPSARTWRRGT